MIPLAHSTRIDVPVKRVEANLLWLSQDHRSSLASLQSCLDHLSAAPFTYEASDLSGLGVVSTPNPAPFSKRDTPAAAELLLHYSRFHDPYGVDVGPGRNATINDCEYKGIGRNSAANRADWHHSWGGMSIIEILVEVLIQLELGKAHPDAVVALKGAFQYQDYDHGFIIRDSHFVRCCQVHPLFFEADKEALRQHALGFWKVHPADLYVKIIERFIDLYASGIYHLSPTTQNITLDGRLLDNFSIEVLGAHASLCPLSLVVKLVEPRSVDSLRVEDITGVSASIDHLWQQCLVVRHAFESLALPVLSLAAIEALVRSRLPVASDFLVGQAERKEVLLKFLSRHASSSLLMSQDDFGNLVIRTGRSLHRKSVLAASKATAIHRQLNIRWDQDAVTSFLKTSLGQAN